ncbi:beta-microseminoprotein-like isoform X2 [Takifugu flavidus]|uniref:beta-microseminoprotein-like isoform X2 n=1 Tax=Takifugu flavidus TaxID=433684 RepID=UPI002544920E|nr:beta-microseminoprotein-like isoform X2 [Takifugu flavidus]
MLIPRQIITALKSKGLCKHYLRRAPFNIDTTIHPLPNRRYNSASFIMKYLLALAVLTCAQVLPSHAFCYVKPMRKDMTHCMDETDGTWHAIGSSWRNSECMDCTCASCCSAYSRPTLFDDDCISVFDKVACEYKVYKKDNPSISCPIYGSVGK